MADRGTSTVTADDYLNELCEQVQLSETQFNTATKRYHRVGEHLTAADSNLDRLSPEVFPQGSMLLRTTVRPLRKDREVVPFDLDAVCLCNVDPRSMSSKSLYSRIETRLLASADYAKRLSAEPKCLRLEYEADDFYLDVVPACKDPQDPAGIRLLIPDRAKWTEGRQPIDTWRSTDPLRFAAWFEAQSEVQVRGSVNEALASISPVPPQEPTRVKAPLRKVVQLLKRQRDVTFLGDACRPSSILLTTLGGNHYRGQPGLAESMVLVLMGIDGQIRAAGAARIKVPNPVEPREDLAAPMTEAAYAKFVAMVRDMITRISLIRKPLKPTDLGESLLGLAGPKAAATASGAVQDRIQAAASNEKLGVGIGAPAIHVVRGAALGGVATAAANTFHGDR